VHGSPAYRAFELLHKSGPLRAAVATNTAKNLTVVPLLTADKGQLTVLLAYHGTPSEAPLAELTVDLEISGFGFLESGATAGTATVGRINATAGNPQAAWVAMGAPDYPTRANIAALMKASEPSEESGRRVVAVRSSAAATGGALSVPGLTVEAYSLVYVRIAGIKTESV
jgi:hypothetical protein